MNARVIIACTAHLHADATILDVSATQSLSRTRESHWPVYETHLFL
jgi:hypothetical protein